MKTRLLAFRFAIQGIVHGLKTEAHLRFHVLAALLVIGLGCWLSIRPIEWCLVTIAIGAVISGELINAALERLADRITKEEDPLIGQAKDLGAGAVLVVSIMAVCIAIWVFGPYIYCLLN
jgi:diacylglycerol kinase